MTTTIDHYHGYAVTGVRLDQAEANARLYDSRHRDGCPILWIELEDGQVAITGPWETDMPSLVGTHFVRTELSSTETRLHFWRNNRPYAIIRFPATEYLIWTGGEEGPPSNPQK